MWILLLFVLTLSINLLVILTRNNKLDRGGYWLLMLFLTGFLCFRYGQGTDYLAYEGIFDFVAGGGSFDDVHGEYGWLWLCRLFDALGLNFIWMEAILSFLEMLCLHCFIRKWSPMRCLSLLIFLPSFYFVYYCSALRQAVTIALFLGFGMDYLMNRQWLKYCLVVSAASLFHVAAVPLFLLPILVNGFKLKVKVSYVVLFLALCAGAWSVLLTMGGEVNYTEQTTYSSLAALLRLLLFVMACFLYSQFHLHSIPGVNADRMTLLMKIYIVGVGGFFMLFPSAIISQRLTVCFKVVEIALFPMLVSSVMQLARDRGTRLVFTNGMVLAGLLAVVLSVEMIKNIDAAMWQGKYAGSIFDYPYISIFE